MATKNMNIYTVSVVTALQFLYDEYLLIGGKGNMMKVHKKLKRNIN